MTTQADPGRGAGPDDDADLRTVAPESPVRRWLKTNGAWVLILDLALIALFSLISTDNVFWSTQNFQSLSLAGTEALLLALGLALMLGAGIFDLSIGANLVLCSVVGAKTIQTVSGVTPAADGTFPRVGWAIAAALAACLVTGLLFGLVNGLVIAYLKVNSLIATLGTLGIGTGIGFVITNGGDIGGLPPQLQQHFGLRLFAGVPVPAIMALILAVIFWAVLRYLVFGVTTLAIGSSRTSAARAGINVQRHIVYLTIIGGFCAGLAGFVDIARYGSTTVNGHATDGLAALTAVVIGGTTLEGGRVNILGAVWGTVLAVVLLTGLIITGVAPYYQLLVIGAVLIAAVAVDQFRSVTR